MALPILNALPTLLRDVDHISMRGRSHDESVRIDRDFELMTVDGKV